LTKSGDMCSSGVEGVRLKVRGGTLKQSRSMRILFLLIGKEAEWQICGNGGAIREVGWYWGYIRE